MVCPNARTILKDYISTESKGKIKLELSGKQYSNSTKYLQFLLELKYLNWVVASTSKDGRKRRDNSYPQWIFVQLQGLPLSN